MSVYEVDGFIPQIGVGTYVDEAASVIGNVVIGRNCYIAPGARIRGDFGRIEIGDGTSAGDNCIIHARPGEITRIGSNVTIAHGCVLDSCTVMDNAVLGINSVITNWALINQWAVVAEGALVRNGFEVPEGRIAVGVPARVLDVEISDSFKEDYQHFKDVCVRLAKDVYPRSLRKVDWKPTKGK
jgi:phenylacetic acid degradation protein